MNQTNLAVSDLDSTATEYTVPVLPDNRITYLREEAVYAYTIRAKPSFNIKLERTSDGWIIRDAETEVSGEGSEILKAAANFERNAALRLAELEQRQHALPEELFRHLQYLRARVRR